MKRQVETTHETSSVASNVIEQVADRILKSAERLALAIVGVVDHEAQESINHLRFLDGQAIVAAAELEIRDVLVKRRIAVETIEFLRKTYKLN